MLTSNTQFEYELKKRIDAEIEFISASALSSPDFPTLRFYAGIIHALRSVRDVYCPEINSDINQNR